MSKKNLILIASLLALTSLLPACSSKKAGVGENSKNEEVSGNTGSEQSGFDLPEDLDLPSVSKPAVRKKTSNVEVVWAVPNDTVKTYHLSYGFRRNALTKKVSIAVASLEKIQHPVHGPAFRYELKNVPRGKKVFISLKAENEFGTSPASEVIEVKNK